MQTFWSGKECGSCSLKRIKYGLMGLTNLGLWANRELDQCSLKPIASRYSKSPGYRVFAAFPWITLKPQNQNPSTKGILEDTHTKERSPLQGKIFLTTFKNIQVEFYKEKTSTPRRRSQPSTTIKAPIPSQVNVRIIYPLYHFRVVRIILTWPSEGIWLAPHRCSLRSSIILLCRSTLSAWVLCDLLVIFSASSFTK